jgi:hypothetical protein
MKNGKWKMDLARSFQERGFEIFIPVLSWRLVGSDGDRLFFSRFRFDLRPGLDPGVDAFLLVTEPSAPQDSEKNGLDEAALEKSLRDWPGLH